MIDRPEEQDAVYTTIVGGRPPGCGTKVGEVPRGIEVLVKKAAVDPVFKELLLEDRSRAATTIGLELEPAEKMMIDAIPGPQLTGIIDRTTVPEKQRPALLGKVAAVMCLALGIGLAGCSERTEEVSKGIRPDHPNKSEHDSNHLSRGCRPDAPRLHREEMEAKEAEEAKRHAAEEADVNKSKEEKR